MAREFRTWIAGVVASALAIVPVAEATWTQADVGEWRIVWSVSEAIGVRNRFDDLGLEVDFPVTWRRVLDSRGTRLDWYDELGRVARSTPLASGEKVVVASDGSAWVRWSADPTDRGARHLAYWTPDTEEPRWEAATRGNPILLAPRPGGLLVTSSGTATEASRIVHAGGAGQTQIIAGTGALLEELPYRPRRVACTGDGRRYVLLRPGELVALEMDGSRAWSESLPIDEFPARVGQNPLSCGGTLISVCGTAGGRARFRGGLHIERRGHLQVWDIDGRFVWEKRQAPEDEQWFSATSRLSEDGNALAFVRLGATGTTIASFEAATGEPRWERRVERRIGLRTLSLSRSGERVALAHGGTNTHVLVTDDEGEVIFEGNLPLDAQVVEVARGNLLVAERWVVLFRGDESEEIDEDGQDGEVGENAWNEIRAERN